MPSVSQFLKEPVGKTSLGRNKRSKVRFKRRGKENVDRGSEPAEGNLLQKPKVDLCSLEKRLRCFRHKIGEIKIKDERGQISIWLLFQIFLGSLPETEVLWQELYRW